MIKSQRLRLLANNSRFLILPHVHIPNLASRILALNLKRLSQDWQKVYGHPIWLVETFVDPRYFKGSCYKAAGWNFLGYSKGFAKSSRGYVWHNQPKMVFVRALHPQVHEHINTPYLSVQFKKEIKPMKLSAKNAQTFCIKTLFGPTAPPLITWTDLYARILFLLSFGDYRDTPAPHC